MKRPVDVNRRLNGDQSRAGRLASLRGTVLSGKYTADSCQKTDSRVPIGYKWIARIPLPIGKWIGEHSAAVALLLRSFDGSHLVTARTANAAWIEASWNPYSGHSALPEFRGKVAADHGTMLSLLHQERHGIPGFPGGDGHQAISHDS